MPKGNNPYSQIYYLGARTSNLYSRGSCSWRFIGYTCLFIYNLIKLYKPFGARGRSTAASNWAMNDARLTQQTAERLAKRTTDWELEMARAETTALKTPAHIYIGIGGWTFE